MAYVIQCTPQESLLRWDILVSSLGKCVTVCVCVWGGGGGGGGADIVALQKCMVCKYLNF